MVARKEHLFEKRGVYGCTLLITYVVAWVGVLEMTFGCCGVACYVSIAELVQIVYRQEDVLSTNITSVIGWIFVTHMFRCIKCRHSCSLT